MGLAGRTGGSHQSAFAAAKSQYLQRTGAIDAPVVTTAVSISTVSMPTASVPAHRLARNTASSSPAVSSLSSQPLVNSSNARPAPASNSQKLTSQIRSSALTADDTTVNCKMTTPRVSSRLTTNSAGYVSPFISDKMLATTAAVTTTACTPGTSTYTSSRPLTAATTGSRQTRTELLLPSQLNHSAKTRLDGAQRDAAVKQTQARERKETQSVAEQWRAGVTSRTTAGKTDWQLEAERRQVARNGVYIDPEKQRRSTLRPQTTLSTCTDGGKPKVATLSAARGSHLQTSSGSSMSVTKPVSNTPDGLSSDDTPPWRRSVEQRSVGRDMSPPSSVRRNWLTSRPKSQQAATVSAVDGRALQQRLKHSQSDSLYQRHDRFMSKKSASIAFQYTLQFTVLILVLYGVGEMIRWINIC